MQVKPSRSIWQVFLISAIVRHSNINVTWLVFSGTSNWSETYFTQTAGVGLVVNQTGSEVKKGQETLQSQAQELFLRDWTSDYASALSMEDVDICPRGPHWVVFVRQSTMLIPSTWTLLCSMQRCVNELLIIYCCFLTRWHFSVKSSVFIFCSEPFIFVLCAADVCFIWVKMQRTMVSSFYAEAFCIYFPSAKL